MGRENYSTAEDLAAYQSMGLDEKISLAKDRIWSFYNWADYDKKIWNKYISFSGGKDSTVLLDLIRTTIPGSEDEIPAVFCDTGLEYPEIRQFARSFPGVETIRPKMRFDQVISTYGYPLISKEVAQAIFYARRLYPSGSNTDRKCRELRGAGRTRHRRSLFSQEGRAEYKDTGGQDGEYHLFNKEKYLPLARDLPIPVSHYCCNVMKKTPFAAYARSHNAAPFLGTLAEESRLRTQGWIRHGCNAFDSKKPTSQPLSVWLNQNILQYIVLRNLKICSVYGDIVATDQDGNEYPPCAILGGAAQCGLKCTGCQRTGCMFCCFGLHLERGATIFQQMAYTHPRQYEFALGGGQWVDNPKYDPTAPKMDGAWQNWNPKKIWVPSKKGLGMRVVFEMVNEIYGKDFYRYE